MTLAELLADLNARIGSEPEVDNAQMTFWLNEAMRIFAEEHPFYWLAKRATFNTVADQSEYSLPTDFKEIVELRIDPTSDSPNVYGYKPYQQRFGVESTEKTVSLIGSVMRVTPTPTASGTNNCHLTYIRRPTNMSDQSDKPSDTDIAGMPEVFHPALVIYSFGIYQGYDEEHAEMEQLMGNPDRPRPGTYNWYVKMAKREDERRKRGVRRKMLSKQEAIGYSRPDQTGAVSDVLKI